MTHTANELQTMITENNNLIKEFTENTAGIFTVETIKNELALLKAEIISWAKQLKALTAPKLVRDYTNAQAISTMLNDYKGEENITFTTDTDHSEGITFINLNIYIDGEYMDSLEVAHLDGDTEAHTAKAETLEGTLAKAITKQGYDLED